jgi:hypothetical protein
MSLIYLNMRISTCPLQVHFFVMKKEIYGFAFKKKRSFIIPPSSNVNQFTFGGLGSSEMEGRAG